MKTIKSVLSILLLTLSANSHAITCPYSYQVIHIGQTFDEIIKMCGEPDNVQLKMEPPSGPQTWTYLKKSEMVSAVELEKEQGSMGLSIVFDAEKKAASITINGREATSTTVCGPEIKSGDTESDIQLACGKPTYITQGKAVALGSEKDVTVKTVIYNSSPPITLRFENGILKEAKQ